MSETINKALVAQSALSLIVAITIADTIRETFAAVKPAEPFNAFCARLVLITLVLIGAIAYYEWYTAGKSTLVPVKSVDETAMETDIR